MFLACVSMRKDRERFLAVLSEATTKDVAKIKIEEVFGRKVDSVYQN